MTRKGSTEFRSAGVRSHTAVSQSCFRPSLSSFPGHSCSPPRVAEYFPTHFASVPRVLIPLHSSIALSSSAMSGALDVVPWRRRLPSLFLAAAVAIAAAVAVPPPSVAAIQFDVFYEGQRCITEELTPYSTVNGLVHVADGPTAMSVDVFVSDSRGQVHFHKAGAVHEAFSFKTGPPPPSPYGGHEDPHAPTPFRICAHHAPRPDDPARGYRRGSSGTPPSRRVTVSLTQGLSPVAREGLAKRGHVDTHVERVRELEYQLQAVIGGIDDMKAVEADVLRKNDDTNLRVLWYSVAACGVMIGAGAYQVFYMKTFFKRAKLI